MTKMIDPLIADSFISETLGVSPEWVRKQRFLRRRGQSHLLSIDPVMIGKCPRYKISEFEVWLEEQSKARPGNQAREEETHR
jgi:hypothetical protein